MAAEKGFLYFDPEPDRPEHRFNDGKCDPAGRFWAGTMPICEEGNSGAMYCLHADGHAERMATDYAIANGILWNADATTMYHIDSPTRQIDAWDFDHATGEELARLDLPVSQVSACAFGGPNLDELYITSARKNLSEEALEKQPHAGSLFKARLGVTGTEFTRFAS